MSDKEAVPGFWNQRLERKEMKLLTCFLPERNCASHDPLSFRPCPLVFFRDASGDEESFRFLWLSMPHCMAAIKLTPSNSITKDEGQAKLSAGCAAREVGRRSKVVSIGDNSEGWAFSSWNSKRILCLLTRDKSSPEGVLYVRGDDETLVKSLVGSISLRNLFVSDLTGGQFVPWYALNKDDRYR